MRRVRARVLGVAAAVLLAVTGTALPAAAQEQLAGTARVLPSDPGTVRVVVSARSLPHGASLEPDKVRVTGGGFDWQAQGAVVEQSAATVQRTAVLAVDTSGSMGQQGIADARAAASRFLELSPADVSVGLVTFADRAELVVAPTRDRTAVLAALQRMQPAGNTTLYDGIAVALGALGTEGERALVVLSDGQDTASQTDLPTVSAQLAGAGAAVDLVSFGKSDSQRAALQQLAVAAKGRLSLAENGAQLTDVFSGVARTLVNEVVVTAIVPEGATGPVTDLSIEVDAGDVTVVTATQVSLPVAAVDARGTVAGVGSQVQTSIPWLLPAVLVVAFLALFSLFAVGLSGGTWRATAAEKRTKDIQRYTLSPASASAEAAASPTAVTQAALAWAGRTVQRRGVEDSWRMELDRAAIPLRPQEWFIVRAAVALVGVAAGVLLLPWWLLTAPLTGLLFWVLAGQYVKLKARRRLKKFAENLPDVLQLMAGSLRSGFSLPQAVDNAAKDGEQPMAGELSRALAESRLGVDLEDALDRVAERMRSSDLAWTVMAIRIAREVGGNLAEVLLSTAETMRERGRIMRQVRVLSAEGRLSAYVLLGLPTGITGFMVLFRGSYISTLVTDPLGWLMSVYALVSVCIGAWVMSRMCKLEV